MKLLDYCDANQLLNDVVIPGSHDAGITAASDGGANSVTQDLDIQGQANAGVRVFDLRIGAFSTGTQSVNGIKDAELKAIHLDSKLQNIQQKQRNVNGQPVNVDVTYQRLGAGAKGLGLDAMLNDANQFLQQNPNEFLIFKFHRTCTNVQMIANSVQRICGNRLLLNQRCLNELQIRSLAGCLIPVFEEDTVAAPNQGIYGCKNLYKSDDVFDANYAGLQYVGKGGTRAWNGKLKSTKIEQNRTKQRDVLDAAQAHDYRVLGMMYWTSTGLLASIKKRDGQMWNRPNKQSLRETWESGLGDTIGMRLTPLQQNGNGVQGLELRRFLPNIVMIDFADVDRCRTIYELNLVNGGDLLAIYQEAMESDGEWAQRMFPPT